MSDKIKLDIACELLRVAIAQNKAGTTERAIAKKWVEMSLRCSNRKAA